LIKNSQPFGKKFRKPCSHSNLLLDTICFVWLSLLGWRTLQYTEKNTFDTARFPCGSTGTAFLLFKLTIFSYFNVLL